MKISLSFIQIRGLRGVPLTSFVLCGFQFLYPHTTVLATLPNAPVGVVSFFFSDSYLIYTVTHFTHNVRLVRSLIIKKEKITSMLSISMIEKEMCKP